MRRLAAALLAATLMLSLPTAAGESAAFGVAGEPRFAEYAPDTPIDAPEPTIGIPWNTDHVFYLAGDITFRITFDDDGAATWEDVSPLTTTPVNLDPMLIADERTGRIWTGGLVGPCSIMHFSDDDGNTWVPGLNMCSGAQFDHQSIGMGPKPIIGNPTWTPSLQNAYYCGQLIAVGCAVSLDGGETWTESSPAVAALVGDGCGGFHGHWRTSPVTGTAFLPVPGCGDLHGMLIPNLGVGGTEIGGAATAVTWEARLVEGSHAWTRGFDPSIGVSADNGWLYYGMADHMGARMALSTDEGLTWEALGPGANATWLDVGQFHDRPVVAATFADVQAGDDERAAFTFLGLEDQNGDGTADEYPDLYACEEPAGGENRLWHYYAAFTFDAGATWNVTRITDHPVQIGGIWDGGGGNPCRNLLDFNDMDIDSTGRVHIAFADGCIGDCLNEEPRYSREARLLRQSGGLGLFAAFDSNSTTLPATPAEGADADGEADNDTPGTPVVALLAAIATALVAIRRRR